MGFLNYLDFYFLLYSLTSPVIVVPQNWVANEFRFIWSYFLFWLVGTSHEQKSSAIEHVVKAVLFFLYHDTMAVNSFGWSKITFLCILG